MLIFARVYFAAGMTIGLIMLGMALSRSLDAVFSPTIGELLLVGGILAITSLLYWMIDGSRRQGRRQSETSEPQEQCFDLMAPRDE